MPKKMLRICHCNDCRKMRKFRNKILGKRLLKHLGAKAYFVSTYETYQRDKRDR